MSKKIEINGLHNKYMMKKYVIKEKQETKNAKYFFTNCYNYKYQKELLHKIYLNEMNEDSEILKKELERKIYGYLNQDKKKERYNEDLFISLNELIEKLVESQMNCYYCKCEVLLLYENTREPNQWTLERLNNNIQHQLDNIEICCFKCNIQRKNQNHDNFKMGKQMKIIKLN